MIRLIMRGGRGIVAEQRNRSTPADCGDKRTQNYVNLRVTNPTTRIYITTRHGGGYERPEVSEIFFEISTPADRRVFFSTSRYVVLFKHSGRKTVNRTTNLAPSRGKRSR